MWPSGSGRLLNGATGSTMAPPVSGSYADQASRPGGDPDNAGL
jgi:hypothetical protein